MHPETGMPSLIPIDGSRGEGGGQILRTALTLSAVTGQGFEIAKIRAGRLRPGLRPQHVAAVRAATLACGAKVGGAFEGSPDLRFEPGSVEAGDFRFEIATAGAATLVVQAVLPALARAGRGSQVEVTGGTHVPTSPSFDFLARHWEPIVGRVGLGVRLQLTRAGFYPKGGGEVRSEVRPWVYPESALRLEARGEFSGIRGISGSGRLRGDVARRQRDAAQAWFWERRRLEGVWDVVEVPAASPGSFLLIEAVFQEGRLAVGVLGRRGLRAEVLGEQAARTLLGWLDLEGAVDAHLADQLAVPLALSGRGGCVSTVRVTEHLRTVAWVLSAFGFPTRVWGRTGGPGGMEVQGR